MGAVASRVHAWCAREVREACRFRIEGCRALLEERLDIARACAGALALDFGSQYYLCMNRIVAYLGIALLCGALLVPLASGTAEAACIKPPTQRWPSSTVPANGSVTWNPTTQGYINSSVQAWTAVTPSPLTYKPVVWLTSIPGAATGLKIIQGRFSGDDSAPGFAIGASTANHSAVTVILSSYASRWSWSNTQHGPWHDSGAVNTDIRTVVIHEVGHAGGLNHPNVCTSNPSAAELAGVMTAQWSAPRRALGSDDKAGFNALGY